MTSLIKTNKQLKADVKKFGLSSISKAKGAIEDSILCGTALIKLKEITPHGKWESEFKSAIDGVFGLRHGQKLMQISAQKDLLLIAPKDEVLTLNDALEFISNATPEQLEMVKQIEAERLAAEEQAKADRAAKAAELEARREEEQTIAQVQTKEPEIIEGDFQEVKNTATKAEEVKTGFVQIEAEKMEEIEDSLHELASLNKSISKDNDSMVKIFDANDQLGAAVKEIKRLNDLNTSLEGRLNGFMNERNALIKEAKYWRARAEKLEKANVK